MALVMVIALIGVPKAARAASTTITITADKTEAEPGDTINMSITLGPVSDMGTMQMVIVIPDGLTYVQGSGAIPSDLRTTLGFDMADFTEISMMVNGVASKGDYSSEEDTLLCTFSCTVNKGFHGTAEVGLTELEFYSCRTWQDHTSEYSAVPAVITVAGADTEKESAGPAETTTAAETTKPDGQETTSAAQPAESSNSEAQPAESTQDGTPLPGPSGESSEATQSGENATEEAPVDESSKAEEGSTAPRNTDGADSSEAAVSTEGQNTAGTESTASEADTKDNTDKAGTKPVESDKDKNDPDGGKDSSRKSGWIWFAAAALAVFAGAFFMIFLNRRRHDEVSSERGRSRKKAK